MFRSKRSRNPDTIFIRKLQISQKFYREESSFYLFLLFLPFYRYNLLARRNRQLPHAFPNSPSDTRTPLTPNELVNEVLKLQGVVGIVYWVRRGAPDIYKQLKTTGVPVMHIFKDLLSKRKSKDERVLKSYGKLIYDPFSKSRHWLLFEKMVATWKRSSRRSRSHLKSKEEGIKAWNWSSNQEFQTNLPP